MPHRTGTHYRAAAAASLACAGLIALTGLIACADGAAQDFAMPVGNLVTAETRLSHSAFHPGATGFIAVSADIIDGWHINAHEPPDKYAIPTVLEIEAPGGIIIERILYPEPEMRKLEINDTEMPLYHGVVNFGAMLRIDPMTAPGSYTIKATLRYQGCNDYSCVEPASVTVEAKLTVATMEETSELLHEDIFSAPPFEGARAGSATGEGEDSFGGMVAERGLFISFIFIFLGGLALNLTPCIYPLIPITVSYFGGQADGRAGRTFLLTIIYVLGMSITYSVMGTVAAMTGSLFSFALQNVFVILFIVLVMLGLAASMFGLWEFRLPAFLTRGTGSAKKGYLGALFMGLTIGIVAAPCIGPFVLGLLTYVGEIGKPALGFLMFFTLAWGMGLPFIILGNASGGIARLPRSGNWMIWVRKVFGFILVAMAIYFARHLIGAKLAAIGYAAAALAGGVYLGWIDRTRQSGRGFAGLRWVVGIAGVAIAVAVAVGPGSPLRPEAGRPGIAWTEFSEELLAGAADSGRPVMIDFTADWCIPCHELDRKTFSDPDVIRLTGGIVTLRVDLTRSGESERAVKKVFKIRGVPTIIFIDHTGAEIDELRVTGFVGPEEIGRRLSKLISRG